MKTITAVEVNRRFSHLLREVREGASYLVTSHGTPVATLAPADGEMRARMWARDALLARLRGSRRSTSAAGTGTNSMMTTMAATRHPLAGLEREAYPGHQHPGLRGRRQRIGTPSMGRCSDRGAAAGQHRRSRAGSRRVVSGADPQGQRFRQVSRQPAGCGGSSPFMRQKPLWF
jgi:prevent-host-death family protein